MTKGWENEPARHSLAAKGVKSTIKGKYRPRFIRGSVFSSRISNVPGVCRECAKEGLVWEDTQLCTVCDERIVPSRFYAGTAAFQDRTEKRRTRRKQPTELPKIPQSPQLDAALNHAHAIYGWGVAAQLAFVAEGQYYEVNPQDARKVVEVLKLYEFTDAANELDRRMSEVDTVYKKLKEKGYLD
jgi:hypothetical protein